MRIISNMDINPNHFKFNESKLSLLHDPSSSIISVPKSIGSTLNNNNFTHDANVRYTVYQRKGTDIVSGTELYLFSKLNHKTWRKLNGNLLLTPIHINLKAITDNLHLKKIDFNPTKVRGLIYQYSPIYSDLTTTDNIQFLGHRVNFNKDTLVLSIVEHHLSNSVAEIEVPEENHFSCHLQLLV